MTEQLQPFDWKSSNYERPANTWVCGRLCEEGLPCRLGPGSKGDCQVQSRCEPEEKGGKYQCSRSTLHGGKCKTGPAPDGTCCQPDTSCQPRRSLLARRRLLGGIAAFIAASLCLIIFGGASPSPLLSPGAVTASHAKIESNCTACHTAAEGGLGTWIHIAFNHETALKDSALCLKCHAELGNEALFAHGVSLNRLAEITARIQTKNEPVSTPIALQLASLTGPPATKDQLSCSTCHREHHGRKADLTHLTDLQCQTCHTRQFEDFQHGHPALGDYPYNRRSRIYFDHDAHLNRYFVKEEFKRTMPAGVKPDSCNSCHTPDASGRFMLTGSFQNTCASCHEPQIEDLEFPGVPFFALPTISPQIMKAQGAWPNTTGTFKTARLPQLMELLLEQDPLYQNAITQLGTVDYRKLNNADPDQYAAVADIAWSIKRLLYDISTDGESVLQQRLGNSHPEYLHLNPSLIPTLSQAQQIWFPNLATEIKLHGENKPVPATAAKASKTQTSRIPRDAGNGWTLSESDFTIRYRPLGHADPLLKRWFDQVIQSQTQALDRDPMWRILSNPTASGTEDTQGALASGRCLMCHSVDQNPETGLSRINWLPLPVSQTTERFTQFSHAPHLSMGQYEKCAGCHAFEPSRPDNSAILQQDYFARAPSNLFWQINVDGQQTCTSGFQPVSHQTCVTCHNKTTETQSCLQCHNYHAHKRMEKP
tara:strand:- start:694 stop:2817 length:2124 start_codon:yes stop_codon:yes gene_type:complete